jgi:shikimate dehydrogenase
MRKFGLIGYPLGHSFSKQYFTEKFIRENISDCSYNNFPLSDINQLVKLVSEETNLKGLNVTIPYKSEIIRFLDSIDPEAEEIGAVNVIKLKLIDGKIKLHGFNTDVTGIRDSLSPFITSSIRNAIVFGTGGSSRAVCYALKKYGINIAQISREKKSGICTYADINADLIEKTELLVNTTPLGMFPDVNGKPDINYSLLSDKHILFDLVYNPQITSFLRIGIERGCTTIGGLKMLHSQAERAWEIWNDNSL